MAAVLALPERRQQIIQLTVRLAMCLDPEARNFLADCQAGLIEGGLEYMRRRRHEILSAMQEEAQEAIVIVDSTEDQILEQAGIALDALRLAEIPRQVFADLRAEHPPFEVARAILADESAMRQLSIDAVRAHGAANSALYERLRKDLRQRLQAARPAWVGAVPTLEAACLEANPRGADPLFSVIAVDDLRANLVIDLLATSRAEALEYLRNVQQRIDTLLELEAKERA
ncbi:MAG TPA: hypothetical protein VJB14_16890 [Planctomycetota bacterium]|nr:hypothetical protein [Planctomycetota bacterium]